MPADDSIEAALADFAAGFRFDDISPSAIAHTKSLLIDAVGCALIGDLAGEIGAVKQAAVAVFGPGTSTVIGSNETLSPSGATMLNGYLMTAMTVCDVYRPAHCHMTPLIIPPALVAAEEAGASGEQFLSAVTVGMEVMARVARGLDYQAFRARGWHSPGVIGPLGAAAAVGRVEGQDGKTIRHAFGLAASQSGGSYMSWGTPAVKFHQARGAVSGLLASRLAGNGFPGGRFPLTAADGGIYNTHSNGGHPARVVEQLGEAWELEQISVRLWPGASPVQAMLTAIFDLIETEGLSADGVERVEIGISTEDFGTHSGFALPTNTFEALLSYAFLCSAALHDQQIWFDQVAGARLADRDLRTFAAEKVSVVEVGDLPVNGCTLDVTMNDGRSLRRRVETSRG
ncbi:MAG TPA: MmgE/PrpD family protein, partial [Acidimicrobiia bacterium]|nr:MmgE/PrpD family protein [Acidimicrobiia bacterium]